MTQVPPSERCSIISAMASEPIAGTASYVRSGYLLIEDAGPWGHAGLTAAGLGEVAEQIEARAKDAGVKAMVFRPPTQQRNRSRGASEPASGRVSPLVASAPHASTTKESEAHTSTTKSADSHASTTKESAPAASATATGEPVRGGRRVFAARHTGERAMVSFQISDPHELLDLDFAAYADDLLAIHPHAVLESEPVMFVCTHAKRDQCCAIEGRPIARDLADQHPGLVFECSHLGGHRFAPTAIMLPLGAVYGRLSLEDARHAYDLAERASVLPEALRGLSDLHPAEQAADARLRTDLQLARADEVRAQTISSDDSGHVVELRVGQGPAAARWTADVRTAQSEPRPVSCGRSPGPTTSHTVTSLLRA